VTILKLPYTLCEDSLYFEILFDCFTFPSRFVLGSFLNLWLLFLSLSQCHVTCSLPLSISGDVEETSQRPELGTVKPFRFLYRTNGDERVHRMKDANPLVGNQGFWLNCEQKLSIVGCPPTVTSFATDVLMANIATRFSEIF
jgi:hypothetical protein